MPAALRYSAPCAREFAMSANCPFYGRSLVFGTTLHDDFGGSNRCALITSAHSPCWMEVSEQRAPDWPLCPRNPEYAAANVFVGAADPVEDEAQEAAATRIATCIRHLNLLQITRAEGRP